MEALIKEMKIHFVNKICSQLRKGWRLRTSQLLTGIATSFLHFEEDWVVTDKTHNCTALPSKYLALVEDMHSLTMMFTSEDVGAKYSWI